MSNVIKLQRRPRPLRKIYSPQAPYEVERIDWEDGSIIYEVIDAALTSAYRKDGE